MPYTLLHSMMEMPNEVKILIEKMVQTDITLTPNHLMKCTFSKY